LDVRDERMTPVYLDCNASTPLDPRVWDAFTDAAFRNGNANSRHAHGRTATEYLEGAKTRLAAPFAALGHEMVLTSGATESIDLALLGVADWAWASGLRHVVTTAIEHKATLTAVEALRRRGFEVTIVGCDAHGVVNVDALMDALRPDTGIVSVMHVNNETGAIQPIDALAERLAGHDAVLHIDAAQSVGKLQEPLHHPRLDLVSFSGHKVHAPVGVGGLVVRERVAERLSARLSGATAGDVRRPGTPAVALAVALAEAVELAVAEAVPRHHANLAFRTEALSALSAIGAVVHTPLDQSLPHVLSVEMPGRDSETVMMRLADLVSISNGAACTNGTTPSHVLLAMGLSPRSAQSTLRWSWSHMTPRPPWEAIVERLGRKRSAA
jgi:cysteine desulfurase